MEVNELTKKFKKSSIIISTDLETDDLLAIWMLSKIIPNKNIMFLVGEGDSYIKSKRMERYAKSLGFTNYSVVQGIGSKKLFKYDGHDIFKLDEIKEFKKDIEEGTDEGTDDIRLCVTLASLKFFIKWNSPLIFSLKPPRELIELWKMKNTIFKNCIMFGYMSFNLRCLMKEWSHENIIEFLNSFEECYFYETYHAVGKNNIISGKDIDMKKLPKLVYDLMIYWNKSMLENCQETCETYKDRKDKRGVSKFRRNSAVVKAINDNNGEQFVNADCGLIMSLLDQNVSYIKKSLKFDESGYSIFSEGGKINVINVCDKKKFRESQIELLKEMLNFLL